MGDRLVLSIVAGMGVFFIAGVIAIIWTAIENGVDWGPFPAMAAAGVAAAVLVFVVDTFWGRR